MFQQALVSGSRLGRLRRISMAVVLAGLVVTPVGAAAAARNKGVDYTKPFMYDRAMVPEEHSTIPASIDKLLKEGRNREALESIHTILGKDDLAPQERSELLSLAARLEVELGNRDGAIRKAEAATKNTGMSDAEKADNYLLLSRLYLAKQPPDFEKAAEYQRKYNDISGTRTGR